MTTGGCIRVAALLFLCLGSCVSQTRANTAGSAQYAVPNLTGAAALADGTVGKPYVAIVKECYPFSFLDSAGSVSGYLIDQVTALNTGESPLNMQYVISNTTYTGTLEMLRWGEKRRPRETTAFSFSSPPSRSTKSSTSPPHLSPPPPPPPPPPSPPPPSPPPLLLLRFTV